jgi:hypothetical protein
MKPDFKAKLGKSLAAYRQWAATREFTSCRLVHYCGVDKPHATDVPLNRVVEQIAGCLAEGFRVAWHAEAGSLYLSVQEPDGPVPPWSKVLAEEPLADVDQILRDAGFDPSA